MPNPSTLITSSFHYALSNSIQSSIYLKENHKSLISIQDQRIDCFCISLDWIIFGLETLSNSFCVRFFYKNNLKCEISFHKRVKDIQIQETSCLILNRLGDLYSVSLTSIQNIVKPIQMNPFSAIEAPFKKKFTKYQTEIDNGVPASSTSLDLVQNDQISIHYCSGSVSQIIKFKINDSFLIFSDNDEKVQICRFPQTSIIQQFLFPHSDIICDFSSTPLYLVTAGGDGQIALYQHISWKHLDSIYFDLKTHDLFSQTSKHSFSLSPPPPLTHVSNDVHVTSQFVPTHVRRVIKPIIFSICCFQNFVVFAMANIPKLFIYGIDSKLLKFYFILEVPVNGLPFDCNHISENTYSFSTCSASSSELFLSNTLTINESKSFSLSYSTPIELKDLDLKDFYLCKCNFSTIKWNREFHSRLRKTGQIEKVSKASKGSKGSKAGKSVKAAGKVGKAAKSSKGSTPLKKKPRLLHNDL